jgi:plasmid stabilization system protein ParE
MESKDAEFQVVWAPRTFDQFKSFIRFIREDSPQNALKVQFSLLTIIYSLQSNPERFSLDDYKRKNKGNFRYFEKYKMRVSFQISNKKVIIVRCRHSKMEPRKY